MSDQIHQHKISDRYSATPYQGAPRCVLTGNATYSVSERHICFARIYRRMNRGCCCRCSERLCIMHCMLSFARHIWGISFTFSKCARAVLIYIRGHRSHFLFAFSEHTLFYRDQHAVPDLNNAAACEKAEGEIHTEGFLTLCWSNNDTPYLMKVEKAWIKHAVIPFFIFIASAIPHTWLE